MTWQFKNEKGQEFFGMEKGHPDYMARVDHDDSRGRGWYADMWQDNVYRPACYLLPARKGKMRVMLGYFDENCDSYIFEKDIKEYDVLKYRDAKYDVMKEIFNDANRLTEYYARKAVESDEEAYSQERLEQEKEELATLKNYICHCYMARKQATGKALLIIRDKIKEDINKARTLAEKIKRYEASPWLYVSDYYR